VSEPNDVLNEGIKEIPILGEAIEIGEVFAVAGFDSYEALRDSMEWIEVPGAEGMDTRELMLTENQNPDGTWTDPHTGFTSADPSNFDIDHRVPFSQIIQEFEQTHTMSREELLEIYNDPDNLQVLHDVHNQSGKGSETLQQHAAEIQDPAFRREFLQKGKAYLAKLEEVLGPRQA